MSHMRRGQSYPRVEIEKTSILPWSLTSHGHKWLRRHMWLPLLLLYICAASVIRDSPSLLLGLMKHAPHLGPLLDFSPSD